MRKVNGVFVTMAERKETGKYANLTETLTDGRRSKNRTDNCFYVGRRAASMRLAVIGAGEGSWRENIQDLFAITTLTFTVHRKSVGYNRASAAA